MNAIELKKNSHNFMDSIDNVNLLADFYELLKKRLSRDESKLWRGLTKSEQEELLLAFEESEKPGQPNRS
ncbi:MAG: hypothetical protein GXO47_07240 [Chlorobi bacterium]|nr:hypothetical protein [Chlorobiota bacterium]